uniref:Uncharacterized protein n=1 Tax=Triticum urartu TaxID=4572 RepID=A0A8R7UFU9_TRIUA
MQTSQLHMVHVLLDRQQVPPVSLPLRHYKESS